MRNAIFMQIMRYLSARPDVAMGLLETARPLLPMLRRLAGMVGADPDKHFK